ncbi:hypothetical protein BB559_003799 [Furculomyces boomerangus]|uniref:DUF1308 domain-containing protein n=1 Tax=Furculomyces boomerangus TaxID=61424 RepID=A0A2T9YIN7_9FUNG|nr:hypothetical protein BB559_003799 [Furculomyces boomerangus]
MNNQLHNQSQNSLRSKSSESIQLECQNLLQTFSFWETQLESKNYRILKKKKTRIVMGLNRIKNIISSELSFWKTASHPADKGNYTAETAKSPNTPYFRSLHDNIIQATGIVGLLETFSWKAPRTPNIGTFSSPQPSSSTNLIKKEVRIDIVSKDGLEWIKVINKTFSSFWKPLSILEAEIYDDSDSSDFSDTESVNSQHSLQNISNANQELIQTQNGTVWIPSRNAIILLPFFKKAQSYIEASKHFMVNYRSPRVVFMFKNHQKFDDPIYNQYTNILFEKIKGILNEMEIQVGLFDDIYAIDPSNSDNTPTFYPKWSSFTPISTQDLPDISEINLQSSDNVNEHTQNSEISYYDNQDTNNSNQNMTAMGLGSNFGLKSNSETQISIIEEFISLEKDLVLDITTIGALISTTSNGYPSKEIDPAYSTSWLKLQIIQESEFPMLPYLSNMFKNRNLITVSTVVERILKTASEVGGRNEYARCKSLFMKNPKLEDCVPDKKYPAYFQGAELAPTIEALWESWLKLPSSDNRIPYIEVIDPIPSERITRFYHSIHSEENLPEDKSGLKNEEIATKSDQETSLIEHKHHGSQKQSSNASPPKNSFTKLHLELFGTGDNIKATVTTANLASCRILSKNGIHGISIAFHTPRSLSEPRIYHNLLPFGKIKQLK